MIDRTNKKKRTQLKIPTIMYKDLCELKKILKEQYPTKKWKWEDVFRFLIYLARVATKLETSPRFSQETAEPFKFSKINRTIEEAKKRLSEFPTVFEGIIIELLEISLNKQYKEDVGTILEYASLIVEKFHPKSEELDMEVKTLLIELIYNGFIDESLSFSEKYFGAIVPEVKIASIRIALEHKKLDRARNIFAELLNNSEIQIEKHNEETSEILFKLYDIAKKRFKTQAKDTAKHPKDILRELFDAIKKLRDKLYILEVSSRYWKEKYQFLDNIFKELYENLWEEYTERFSRKMIVISLIRSGLIKEALRYLFDTSVALWEYREEFAIEMIKNGYLDEVKKLLKNGEILSQYYYLHLTEHYLRKGEIEEAWDSLTKALKIVAIIISYNPELYIPSEMFLRRWILRNPDGVLSSTKNKKLEDIVSETGIKMQIAVISVSTNGEFSGMRITLKKEDVILSNLPLHLHTEKSNKSTIQEERKLFGELLYRLLQLPNSQIDFDTPIIAYLPYAGYHNDTLKLIKDYLSRKADISLSDIEILKSISFAFIDTGHEDQLLELLEFIITDFLSHNDLLIEEKNENIQIYGVFLMYLTAIIERETLVNGPNTALSFLSEKKLRKFLNNIHEVLLRKAIDVYYDDMANVIVRILIRQGKLDDAEDLVRQLKISDVILGNELIKELIRHKRIKTASRLISELGLDVHDESLESVLIYWLQTNDFERFYLMWKSINKHKKEELKRNIGREIGRYIVKKYFV